MMDLLEKVNHFNAEIAKLGKCVVISKKFLLAENLSASSDITKNDACLRVMSDKRVLAGKCFSTYHFQH